MQERWNMKAGLDGGSSGGWREAGWQRVKATTGGTRGDERGSTLTEEHHQALTGLVLQASGPVWQCQCDEMCRLKHCRR